MDQVGELERRIKETAVEDFRTAAFNALVSTFDKLNARFGGLVIASENGRDEWALRIAKQLELLNADMLKITAIERAVSLLSADRTASRAVAVAKAKRPPSDCEDDY